MKRLLAAAAALVLSLGVAVSATADERDDLQDQIDQNNSKLEQLESELEGFDSELQETYLALEAAERRLPDARDELLAAEEALAAAVRVQEETAARLEFAQNELAELDAEIAETRATMESSQGSLGELARTTYQNGIALSPTALVLSTQSSEDFLSQYSAMESAVRSQTSALSEMNDLDAILRNAEARQEAVAERIEELKVEADAAVVAADEARIVAEERKREIENLIVQKQTYAAALEDQKVAAQEQAARIESDNTSFASEIQRLDEQERERQRKAEEARKAEEERLTQQQSAGSSSSSGSSSSGSSGSSSSTTLGSPISGSLIVTSAFGYRVYPITGGWFMHNGVDLRSACGNPQYSSASGTVSAVRGAVGNGTHGNQVIINNGSIGGNRYITVYNHLSSFAVSAGQSVSAGQVIGYTGATGKVTGCHVHFEIWKNGVAVDPMGIIR